MIKIIYYNFIILLFVSPFLSLRANNQSLTNKSIDEKTIQFWEKTFQYGISSQKENLINQFKLSKDKQGERLLLKYLPFENNFDLKKKMISALIIFSNKECVPYLLEILKKEEEHDKKIFAIDSLGMLKQSDRCSVIQDYINEEDELLAESALRALGDLGCKTCVDSLITKLSKEKNERVKTATVLALANIKDERSQNVFISILTNQEEKEINRGFAITGLGYLKNMNSYLILEKYYARVNPNLQMRILDAIGNLGYREGINLLIDASKDDNKNIRYYAVVALGKLKAKEALDVLEFKKEFDPDEKVRSKVKEILKELKGN